MFGCTATHVQEKIVTMQLQIMFQMLRQYLRSVHEFDWSKWLLIGGIGLARISRAK